MPLRLRVRRADEAPGQKPVTSSETLRSESVARPAHGAAVVRQAQREPSALTPSAVLQLQRIIGNHAVSQVIATTATRRLAEDGERAARPLPSNDETVQRESDAALVQRAKTEEQRSEKHRRVARAKQTIQLLGNNLKPNLDGHLFNARPANGGEPDPDAPTGLHAYTNQALPDGIHQVGIRGSENSVHQLTWRWEDSTQTKVSTMFPRWMPPQHVRTLIALRYPDTRANNIGQNAIYPDYTRTYILHGLEIQLAKSGDTVYPVM